MTARVRHEVHICAGQRPVDARGQQQRVHAAEGSNTISTTEKSQVRGTRARTRTSRKIARTLTGTLTLRRMGMDPCGAAWTPRCGPSAGGALQEPFGVVVPAAEAE